MNRIYALLIFAVTVVAASGCADDKTTNSVPEGAGAHRLHFEALLPESYADLPFAWSAQDTIGVYVRCGSRVTAFNVPFTFESTTAAGARFGGRAIVLPESASYTLYAYYPYKAGASANVAYFLFELPTQQVQSAVTTQSPAAGLLIAEPMTGTTISDFPAAAFGAAFASVEVDLTASGVMSGKKLTAVSLYATPSSSVSTDGTSADAESMCGGFRFDLTAPDPTTATYAGAPASYPYCRAALATPAVLGDTAVKCYLTVAAGDYSRGALYVTAKTDDGTLSTFSVTGRTLSAAQHVVISHELSAGDAPQSEVDLSAVATANCYVVSEAGQSYSFDATVAGNGVITDGLQQAVQRYEGRTLSMTLSGGEARLLWQSDAGLIVPASVAYASGRISFTLTDRPTELGGNAVIGLYTDASSDEALWSWHIWISGSDAAALESAAQTYTLHATYASAYGASESVMMDRNLGAATTADNAYVRSWRAPLYQWGRKDPIPWGKTVYTAQNIVLDYLTGWPAVMTTGAVGAYSGYTGNSYYATAHPVTFIESSDGSSYDWYWGGGAGSSATVRNNELWGNPTGYTVGQTTVKTLFDPCPAGWKIPHPYLFSAFTTSGNTTTVGSGTMTTGSFVQGWNLRYDGTNTTYYPASGYLYDEYAIFTFPGSGYYWSSAPSDNSFGAWVFGLTSTTLYQRFSDPRGFGLSVRCMRDL